MVMHTQTRSLTGLSNRELLTRLQQAIATERHATVDVVALLIEVDVRQLYLAEGCSSLFTYCTQVLHLSEHAAYSRIEAARAAKRFPTILERLADGRMNLTAVGLVARHLTASNQAEILDEISHKGKRAIEEYVAAFQPQPDARTIVRKVPESRAGARESVLEARRATASAADRPNSPSLAARSDVAPLAPERYKVQFTVSRETHEQLRLVQDLLRHTIPNGDVAAIFARALGLLLKEAAREKFAAAQRPRAPRPAPAASRHIPASVKREVWARDGGRCAFRGEHGRCTENGFLEFHHVIPFADGGATTSRNLELRCRAHNAFEAEQWFGRTDPPMVRESREAYG